MTRVFYDPAGLCLRVAGHAGAGEPGRDLVCAAVSALAWTGAARARERPDFGARLRIEPEAAVFEIRCEPAPGAVVPCREMLATLAAGYSLLAERFPAWVTVEGKGN